MSGRVITIIVLIAIVFIYVLYNTQSAGGKVSFLGNPCTQGPDHPRVLSGWDHFVIRLSQDRSV